MLTLIMAGGVGERFWPQSHLRRPKQLLNLTGRGSMIRLTVDRLRNISKSDEIHIITNIHQLEAIGNEVPEISPNNIIAEPEGRNTAPCIGLACHLLDQRFGNRPVLVLPADHIIGDVEKFEQAVEVGEKYVTNEDALLTFGIKPTRPETGYGYIRAGKRILEDSGVEIFRSEGFQEKPDADKARNFMSDGNYYWNSGMFMWKTGVVLAAIARFVPELFEAVSSINSGTQDLDKVLKSIYGDLPAESIDYAVMEKADNVVILKGNFCWNDVGNWESVRELYSPDEKGNVLVGDHIVIDGTGNTIFSAKKLVGLIGINDVVIVEGESAMLVCDRNRTQEVRKIIEQLKHRGKDELI